MHVLGMIVDDDGARMGAGVDSHEQRKHPLKSATLFSTLIWPGDNEKTLGIV